MQHPPTIEQTAIFDAIRTTKGDLVVDALAGSGKTTTILQSLAVIPQKSILLCAFNKRIADTLQAKLPEIPRGTVVHIKTFHAQGLAMLKARFPKLEVNKDATEDLINTAAERNGLQFKARRCAIKLLRLLKETIVARPAPTLNEIEALGHNNDLFFMGRSGVMDTRTIRQTCEVVLQAWLAGSDFSKRTQIDFCDMVWGPLVIGMTPMSRYQAVIVDELQDLSQPQLALLKSLIAPGGRFIGIGDVNQEIYAWRGSDSGLVYREFRTRGAKFLPLTTTFRCATSIVKQANVLVPNLQARKHAPDGIVRSITIDKLGKEIAETKWWINKHKGDQDALSIAHDAWLEYRVDDDDKPLWHAMLADAGLSKVEIEATGEKWSAQRSYDLEKAADPSMLGTFVLSRSNADLLSCALRLWKERVSFQLNAGRDMLEPLYTILDGLRVNGSVADFTTSVESWYASEYKRAEAANATAWAERLDEQRQMLLIAAQYAKPSLIRRLLGDMIEASTSGVLLSTVHKVKGLEAERVFLLKQTFARHAPPRYPDAPPNDPDQEELNIEYVAITRARSELIWVDLKPAV